MNRRSENIKLKSVIRKEKCSNSNKPKIERSKLVETNKLDCVYVNARSIANKKKELELYLQEQNIDIMGISETWLNESITDSEMSI